MDNRTKREDLHLAESLFDTLLQKPETLPVSYTIGGRTYRGLPRDSRLTKRLLDRNIVEMDYEALVDGITVRVEVQQYRDFPAAEWTVYMSRSEEGESPLLTGLNAADMTFSGKNARLITCNGDFYSPDGYANRETAMTDGTVVTMAPVGGRPCDRAFPYQRLLFDGFGLNISVGWPAQWTAAYSAHGEDITFTAGQQVVHTTISRGEVFRSPRMSLVCFVGDLTRGINVWRRWYVAHVMPRSGGEPLRTYICGLYGAGGIEFTKADEHNQIAAIQDFYDNDLGINCWWIDAGWYPSQMPDGSLQWWKTTGTWECDKERFPRGFRPVQEKLAEKDVDLMVWFEVERCNHGTEIYHDHPEFLLRAGEKQPDPEYGVMLNLGNKDCVEWLSHKIADFCIENNIKVYRQDYNFEPLEYWRYNEAENKKGMLENKYVQGYLAYWDYLLWNVPDLVIDSCASGGRRNDLETMRRSVPFHPTDSSYGNHPVQQAFAQTMYSWVPFFRGFTENWEDAEGNYTTPEYYSAPPSDADEYVLHLAIAPCMTLHDIVQRNRKNPAALDVIRRTINAAKTAGPVMMYGDYYPLTAEDRTRFGWNVWQFDKPEDKSGIIRTVRNNGCPAESVTVHPAALEEGAWEFTNLFTGETFVSDGKEIVFTQPVRSCTFWQYKKI